MRMNNKIQVNYKNNNKIINKFNKIKLNDH